jgi:hypothetical protein
MLTLATIEYIKITIIIKKKYLMLLKLIT